VDVKVGIVSSKIKSSGSIEETRLRQQAVGDMHRSEQTIKMAGPSVGRNAHARVALYRAAKKKPRDRAPTRRVSAHAGHDRSRWSARLARLKQRTLSSATTLRSV
jgi:hypothetical protein